MWFGRGSDWPWAVDGRDSMLLFGTFLGYFLDTNFFVPWLWRGGVAEWIRYLIDGLLME